MNEESIQLRIGAIFHHKRFKFANGKFGVKFIILLNEPKISHENCIFAKTTTQQKWRRRETGCQEDNLSFFIDKYKESFSEDIWIQLHKLYPFTAESVLQDSINSNLEFKGLLSDITITQLKNCIIRIKKDVSAEHLKQIIDSYNRRYKKG